MATRRGRSDMRTMMTPEIIKHNCDCFKKQMSRFIDFSEGKAMMVNNAEWLMSLNYIEFLRKWDHIFPSTTCCGLNATSRGWKKGLLPGIQLHDYAEL